MVEEWLRCSRVPTFSALCIGVELSLHVRDSSGRETAYVWQFVFNIIYCSSEPVRWCSGAPVHRCAGPTHYIMQCNWQCNNPTKDAPVRSYNTLHYAIGNKWRSRRGTLEAYSYRVTYLSCL